MAIEDRARRVDVGAHVGMGEIDHEERIGRSERRELGDARAALAQGGDVRRLERTDEEVARVEPDLAGAAQPLAQRHIVGVLHGHRHGPVCRRRLLQGGNEQESAFEQGDVHPGRAPRGALKDRACGERLEVQNPDAARGGGEVGAGRAAPKRDGTEPPGAQERRILAR